MTPLLAALNVARDHSCHRLSASEAVNRRHPCRLLRRVRRGKIQMKCFILVTALLTFIAGTFAAIAPASADKHGDRMRQDCKSGLRKC
jgi:hypothetical protein